MDWTYFYAWLMDREGRGVHQDPRDKGGQTAWGIARKYHSKWRGWALVDAGIVSGPEFEAAVHEFYWQWLKPFWEDMGPRLREAFCDAMVNMGPGRKGDKIMGAVELLQHAMNRIVGKDFVDVDGVYGPQTRAALKTMDQGSLAFALCAWRLSDYTFRAKHGSDNRWALDGWCNRTRDLMSRI